MTTLPDYYEVLQVSPSADEDIIEAAYRRLAKKWHPDRNPGDPFAAERMKLLNEAHEVLMDPVKRRKYDFEKNQSGASGKAKDDPPPTASYAQQKAQETPAPGTLPTVETNRSANDAAWANAIPDVRVIFLAGAVLFLIWHADMPYPAFFMTCFGWAVLFGMPAYFCYQAKKQAAVKVIALVFLLAAGFDVLMGVYNHSERNKLVPAPQYDLLNCVPGQDPQESTLTGSRRLNAFKPAGYRSPDDIIFRAVNAGRTAEDTAKELRSAEFPLPTDFERQYKLHQARQRASQGETFAAYIGRRGIPIISAINTSSQIARYKSALERFNVGKPTQDDFDVIARFEWQNETGDRVERQPGNATK